MLLYASVKMMPSSALLPAKVGTLAIWFGGIADVRYIVGDERESECQMLQCIFEGRSGKSAHTC